jgi:hypothetical protein
MTGNINWYTLIPEKDRIVVDATARWLRPVSWQWFVTLTFPWNVTSETADAKLKQWLNLIERTMRTRVCFVAGKERKPRSHGMEVPWHFHLLVTSRVDIPEELLRGGWRTLVSSAARRHREVEAVSDREVKKDAHVDDNVVVESYKHNRLGPEYCLKSINSCNGDWSFRWLELFNPRIRQTSFPNHVKVRNRSRDAEQNGENRRAMTEQV